VRSLPSPCLSRLLPQIAQRSQPRVTGTAAAPPRDALRPPPPRASFHAPPAPSPARIEEGGHHWPPKLGRRRPVRACAPPRANGRMEEGMGVDCCGRCSLGMGFFLISSFIWWIWRCLWVWLLWIV
jgi:hypothetical protein